MLSTGTARTSGWLASILLAAILLIAIVAAAETSSAQDIGEWSQIGDDLGHVPADDAFGRSVAMNAAGASVIVGAPGSDRGDDGTGYARVFDLVGSTWVQRGTDFTGTLATDRRGAVVEMNDSGTTVAMMVRPSNVAVFDWNGASWTRRGADITTARERPTSLAMSDDGDVLVIGSLDVRTGSVQVFEWDRAAWTQRGGDLNGEGSDDLFGHSVAMNAAGTAVIVGAPDNDGGGPAAGHARAFDWDGATWQQRGADVDGDEDWLRLGAAVAMSADGNSFAVGAVRFDDGKCCNFGPGLVRAFDWNGASWVQRGTDIDGRHLHDDFGGALAMSSDGETLAIGASDALGPDDLDGYVRIVDWVAGTWQPRGTDIDGGRGYDRFGASVAISANGDSFVAGAPGGGLLETTGLVRVFRFHSGVTCEGELVTIDMNVAGVSGIGTNGDDVILGTAGDDRIFALAGNDRVCAGDGRDRVRGGGGDDIIYGGAQIDRLWGDAGRDTIYGDGGSDRIYGGPARDLVYAGSGADRVFGGDGPDVLHGMGGQDFMWGEGGNDELLGNWQSDHLYGGAGDDVLRGMGGKDKLYGGPGTDAMFGGDNTDYLDGGEGIDSADGQRGIDNPLVADVSGCVAEAKLSC